ncbi:MAG: hypothetical protein L6R38_001251 [Xanthoria sp. 2 TBL-2021]|nr:MAG: hypothetical protein L6R38_001251 [Xanthoria sp. 2 TBL-2021]
MVQSYDKIRASRIFHDLMRLLQFLSAVISLGLFSHRLRQIHRLERRTTASTGAVEGILAAAVLYTITLLLIRCLLRNKSAPKFLRWLLIALDLAFVGAFIAVTVLTRPKGGPSGKHGSRFCLTSAQRNNPAQRGNDWCKLPTGTFVLAIVSTYVLHILPLAYDSPRSGPGPIHLTSMSPSSWHEIAARKVL